MPAEGLQLEAVTRSISVKKVFLKIPKNSQENTCGRVSSLIKLQTWGLQLYQKRGSDRGVFLWIFRNFEKHMFYRTPPVAACNSILTNALFYSYFSRILTLAAEPLFCRTLLPCSHWLLQFCKWYNNLLQHKKAPLRLKCPLNH